MEAPRWNIITPSQYEWERRGLDFIRTGLPNHDPYRAWANFEFQTNDGAIYEVDCLVLTKQGFWLVECKAWGGRIWGDVSTWTRSQDGKVHAEDNPLLLANRKAKALSSHLKAQSATSKIRLPWLDALIFLSDDEVHCDLTGTARNRILLKDRPKSEARPEQKGILAALINREGQGIDPDPRGLIDITVAKALSRAMEQAGIRPSQRSRRVGDYVLGELIFDGPGYQDRLAKHVSVDKTFRRIRQYTVAQASSEDERKRLKRAATREFQILQTLDHPNILPVQDYNEHENGPALSFRCVNPEAIRLDHYLNANGRSLDAGQRLELLRQVSDAIRYAHSKRVIHRALGPQSILVVDSQAPSLKLQVYNWQVGVRETASTAAPLTRVEDLVEAQSLVYMSPEALSDSRKVTEASDVFSLGAIAFLLFANRPPAGNRTELERILREQKGLSVSAVLDGAGRRLEELIKWSTHPDVLTRIGSVEDFKSLLVEVEDELTAPTDVLVNDPLLAKQGDRLPHRYIVKRELGRGATARALLVSKDDKELVLKIALAEKDNIRLHEEGDALKSLQSEFIVRIEGELKMGDRTVLVLQKAGDRTLAALLAKEGVLGLELLSRYGDDLLSAIGSLERHGVLHRDIKPDNIGIRSLTKQRNQLILFDFSLAQTPLDHINVGTEGYRDPFLKLRKPPRWDLAAERYSVGVTLYEMTVGHGVLPQWGSDRSDPALTNDELVLETEKFDPSAREGLDRFFRKTLHRDPQRRFESADEMQRAWQQVFTDSEKRKITTPAGEEIDIGVSLDQTTLATPVSALGLSTRARNALERANLVTVRDLLGFPIADIHLMRGVGNQTRQEIIGFVGKLRERFPDLEPAKPVQPSTDTMGPVGPPSLELLHHRVVGTRSPRRDTEWTIRAGLLGVTAPEGQPITLWPSQTDVAESLGVTRARVGQIVTADRNRWSKDPEITSFRHELCEQIQRYGGVVTIAEIVDLTILMRPATNTLGSVDQQRLASAVARSAVETETALDRPRFQLRRIAGKAVITCSPELGAYAEKLGHAADRLAAADPLSSPVRVLQELYEVQQPGQPHGCQPFSNERLVNLAAAMSETAAVSSRQEIYPRGMAAERTLRLGIGALSGLGIGESGGSFSVEDIRNRVGSRYPDADPLPDHPALQDLLNGVGLDLRWDSEKNLYSRREPPATHSSGSSMPNRWSTATSNRQIEVTPDVAEARSFEERLQHAYSDGGFLVLTVRPSRMRLAEAELLRRFSSLQRVSFDALLFDVLREEARELEIEWSVIEQADGAGPASPDWKNLMHLMSRVAPKLASRLAEQPRHLLLVNPGLLARYNLLSVLETLRDRVAHDVPCPGLWVLVATDGQNDMPVLDHAEIPIVTPGQRTRISEHWIENLHRGRAKGAIEPGLVSSKGVN